MIDIFGFHCTKYNVTSIFFKEKPREVVDDVELVFYTFNYDVMFNPINTHIYG